MLESMSGKPNILFVRIAPWFQVRNPHPQDTPLSYDIAYITAMMDKNRYTIHLIDNYIQSFTPETLLQTVLSRNPDVLLVTSEGATIHVVRNLFKEARKRKPDLPTIAFGRQLMYLPEILLGPDRTVDVLILNEPELTALELIERISNGEDWRSVKGVAFWDETGKIQQTVPREMIKDLDSLPFMNHELFESPKYRQISQGVRIFDRARWGFLLTSRGCPYPCTFCAPSIRRSYGQKFRARSPKLVVDEMQYLKERLGVNAVAFGDDVFTLDMQHTETFSDELIARNLGIKWAIATRADRVNFELLKKMKRAGCDSLALGIESGNPRVLAHIRKAETKERMLEAVRDIQKLGFILNLTFIIGHPTETLEEMQDTFRFARELNATYTQFHYFTPYPGTPAYKEYGLTYKDFDDGSHYQEIKKNFSEIPDEELKRALRGFYKSYYFSPRFAVNYVKNRLPYIVFNIGQELSLIRDSAKYMFRPQTPVTSGW
jgi:radical SAM superfamily enzyme YgiQ (UPF0313 family)